MGMGGTVTQEHAMTSEKESEKTKGQENTKQTKSGMVFKGVQHNMNLINDVWSCSSHLHQAKNEKNVCFI
jgi:hypothetical protein